MLNPFGSITADRASLSIGTMFALNSMVFSSWYTRIPEVQNKLGLNTGQLGLALLGMPIGSLLIIPVTSWLISKYAAGKITLISSIGCCLLIPTPVLAENFWSLGFSMLLLGLANGSMDIAMNAQATAIESRRQMPIFSTCHALFSLGGLIGAGLGGIVATLGVRSQIHLGAIAFLMTAVALWCGHALLKFPATKTTGPVFAVPSKSLLSLAVMAFCILLGEGAIGDWSAVYLRNTLHAAPFLAGAGFACFSLGMTIGRLYGDQISVRLGSKSAIRLGTLLAGLGLSFGLLIPNPYAGVFSFGCVGLGYAGIIPIIYRAAAHTPGIAAGTNIAAVASAGYMGFFAGPPLIGFTGQVLGLRIALGIVVFLAVLVNFMAGSIRLRNVNDL